MGGMRIKRFLCFSIICVLAAGAVKFGGTVVYAEDAVNDEVISEEEDKSDGIEDSAKEEGSSEEVISGVEETSTKEEDAVEDTPSEEEELSKKEEPLEEEKSSEKENSEEKSSEKDSNPEIAADKTDNNIIDQNDDMVTMEIEKIGPDLFGKSSVRKPLTINIGNSFQMTIGFPSADIVADSETLAETDEEEPEKKESVTLTARIPSAAYPGVSFEEFGFSPDGSYHVKQYEVKPGVDKIIELLPEAKDVQCNARCGIEWKLGSAVVDEDTVIGTDSTVTISSRSHTGIDMTAKPASCVDSGSTGGKECSNCGWIMEEPETVPALGHEEDSEWRFDDNDEHFQVCSRCDNVIPESRHLADGVRQDDNSWLCKVCKLETIIAHEHSDGEQNWMHSEKHPATCASAGAEEYWYCKFCRLYFADENGENEVEYETLQIPKLEEHTLNSDWESDTDKHWKICQVCDAKVVMEDHMVPIRQEDNSWICIVCNYALKEAHTHGDEEQEYWQHVEGQAATYEAAGVKEHWICKTCNLYYADAEGNETMKQEETEIPKLESGNKKPSGSSSSSGRGESSGSGNTNAADNVSAVNVSSAASGTGNPQTGDSSHIFVWFALTLFSCMGIGVCMRTVRKI